MLAIHIAVWLIVILSPLTFFDHSDKFSRDKLIPMISCPLMMMVVFYTMYLYITPKYLFGENKRKFWIYTILLRNVFSMTITATIAAMSVITTKWHHAEDGRQKAELARQKAEVARADAELKNLRNQINPHFLLNTLNNIYALIAFNQDKAQNAVLELSGMLRHILYDNQQEFVNLNDEAAFIESYINLMRIRVAKTCDISVNVDIPNPCEIKVAPLIFISLIENAFKHGIAATGKSFIKISINADNSHIECDIENSNHPKEQSDRSGHGIGLEQVARRLELSYNGKYTWENGTRDNNSIYYSKIIIYDTKLRNN